MSDSTKLETLRKSLKRFDSICDADVRAESTDLMIYNNLKLSELNVILLQFMKSQHQNLLFKAFTLN